MKSIIVLLPLLIVSCSSLDQYPRHSLSDQFLSARPGHEGKLTNNACEAWDSKNNCTNWVVKDYDINDATVRKTLNDLSFWCRVSGKLYKVCLDKPGLCRRYRVACGFLGMDRCQREDYIGIDKYQFLIDASVRCFNANVYGFDLE